MEEFLQVGAIANTHGIAGMSQGVWIGLIVGLATTILWPILLKVTKEEIGRAHV